MYSKYEVIQRLMKNIELLQDGKLVTIVEIFGRDWNLIPPATRGKVLKEFKSAVCRGELRGIKFAFRACPESRWLFRIISDIE